MIDIHHHCLPATDDGPSTWDAAVRQCHIAAKEGIETIIATPHVLRGRWETPSPEAIEAGVSELQRRCGSAVTILAGSEYYFGHDMLDLLRHGTAIVPLAGSRYILVEFASMSVPPLVENELFRLQLEGWTPIIAHPERNTVFQNRPELLAACIEKGARVQITAMSLTGAMGRSAAGAARHLLDHDMVHFLATDAHNETRRPPLVREAREILARGWGEERAAALTILNPAAVVAGTRLPYDPETRYPLRPNGFLASARRLFRKR